MPTEIRYWRFQLATIGVTVLSGSLSNSLTHLGGGVADVDVCWWCWYFCLNDCILLSRHKNVMERPWRTIIIPFIPSLNIMRWFLHQNYVFKPVVKQPVPWVRDDPNPAGQCLIHPLRCCGSWGSDDPDAGRPTSFDTPVFLFNSPQFVKDMH